jgi:hypothetical protein
MPLRVSLVVGCGAASRVSSLGWAPPRLTDWYNGQWNEQLSGLCAAKIFIPLGLRVKYSK